MNIVTFIVFFASAYYELSILARQIGAAVDRNHAREMEFYRRAARASVAMRSYVRPPVAAL